MSVCKIPYEKLLVAVKDANKITDVLDNLGYKTHGGNASRLSKRLKELGISTSHFVNWNSGSRIKTEDFLIKDSNVNNQTVKRRIIKEGILPYNCFSCGIGPVYNGKPLVLQMDHIDGDNKNNLLENLRFLCPNCHSQTETFSGRNIRIKNQKCKGL